MENSLNIMHVIQTNNAHMIKFADKYGRDALIDAIKHHAFHYYIGGSLLNYYAYNTQVQKITPRYIIKTFKKLI